jgi:hypothetical protein
MELTISNRRFVRSIKPAITDLIGAIKPEPIISSFKPEIEQLQTPDGASHNLGATILEVRKN